MSRYVTEAVSAPTGTREGGEVVGDSNSSGSVPDAIEEKERNKRVADGQSR